MKTRRGYQGNVLLGYGGLSEEQIQLGVDLLQKAWDTRG